MKEQPQIHGVLEERKEPIFSKIMKVILRF